MTEVQLGKAVGIIFVVCVIGPGFWLLVKVLDGLLRRTYNSLRSRWSSTER